VNTIDEGLELLTEVKAGGAARLVNLPGTACTRAPPRS